MIVKQCYQCGFCRRFYRLRKQSTIEHELHCFRNPARIPYEGEVTSIEQTGTIVNCGYDDSIKGPWYEWAPNENIPAWFPGPGKIWNGYEWRDIPGYSQRPAKPRHGCAGGAPNDEEFPMFEGVSLRQLSCRDRLAVLFPIDREPVTGIVQ